LTPSLLDRLETAMAWTRRTWMTLATASALSATAAAAVAALAMPSSHAAELVKTAATFQFMHAMATFACATVMQIGGKGARHAPAFFLGGIVLFCGPLYALALGAPRAMLLVAPLGVLAFLAGWCALGLAAMTVDPAEGAEPIAGRHGFDNLMRIPGLGRRP
jgi:uncharacterized membrane protein YgdD (TMEM256/DUF423 family)